MSLVSTSGEGYEYENKVLASLCIAFRLGCLDHARYPFLLDGFSAGGLQAQLFGENILTDDVGIFGCLDGDPGKTSKSLISVKRTVQFTKSDKDGFGKTLSHAARDYQQKSLSDGDQVILLFDDAPKLHEMEDLLHIIRGCRGMFPWSLSGVKR